MADKGVSRKKQKRLELSSKTFAWDYYDQFGKKITSKPTIDRCSKLTVPSA